MSDKIQNGKRSECREIVVERRIDLRRPTCLDNIGQTVVDDSASMLGHWRKVHMAHA